MMSAGRWLLVGSTLVAPPLAAALMLAGPPSAWLVPAVPLAYGALLMVGVLAPRLAMFAPVRWRGSASRPEVALTFDDGPDPDSTPEVLAVLARHGVHATFFVLGEKVRLAPQVVAAIASAGHEIEVHGDTHDRLLSVRPPAAIAAALTRALDAVAAACGARPHYFRPPIGHVSPRTAKAARQLGLALVAWSVRSRDGAPTTTATQATRRVLAGLRPGAIILMHDAAERGDRRPVAIAALPSILDAIARRGLACVTLSQLLRP